MKAEGGKVKIVLSEGMRGRAFLATDRPDDLALETKSLPLVTRRERRELKSDAARCEEFWKAVMR